MKTKKRKGFLKEKYSESFEFIKESRLFIYNIIAIFFIFSLVGFFIPVPDELAEQIMEFIEELLKETENLSQFELIKFIFFNNTMSSFFAMFLGVFLGIFSIMTIVLNGYILGFVAYLVVGTEGPLTLLRLLPHGIFELPAIFISAGLGLKIGSFVLEKKKLDSLKKYLKKSFITFVFVIIPLLIIAAIIEGSLIIYTGD